MLISFFMNASEFEQGMLALVVDDVATNRKLLSAVLKRKGVASIEAVDGLDAIVKFKEHPIDIVFMDIMMPNMDGYEATRQIKALQGERFVPVLMVTALDEKQGLVEAIEAGADDYLTKPIDAYTINAKMAAMDRIRQVYKRLLLQNVELQRAQQHMRTEQVFAENIFQKAINQSRRLIEGVTVNVEAADIFSGDLVLQTHTDDGSWALMVCDFTGHGLPAAIGAVPVSDTFYVMTRKGIDAGLILKELNSKLRRFLPVNMFMGCVMLSFNKPAGQLHVWNGGMPKVIIKSVTDGKVKGYINSYQLPLGIAQDEDMPFELMSLDLQHGDCLIIYSDGLIEAENHAGQQFGMDRLIEIIEKNPCDGLDQAIIKSWQTFHSSEKQLDDVTLVTLLFQNP